MPKHGKIQGLGDFFLDLGSRRNGEVYFYRINSYSEAIGEFIRKYYEAARTAGVILEGKIPNPDEKNLSYYSEIMGMGFQMNQGFLTESLKKWLPRMNGRQREYVSASMYDSLERLRRAGKNENMLKNAYIKFMCWLYYRFERIVNQLGQEKVPKILYEGDITNYELMILSILSNAGCDVILLQYHGDQGYRKLDEGSVFSEDLPVDGGIEFPSFFNLKWIREEIQNTWNSERLYGQKPRVKNCTNAWIEGKGLSDIGKSPLSRGSDPDFFYNCYCRINGVWDKLTYANDLFLFQQELRNAKRKVVIVDGCIPKPSTEEIAGIRRANYARQDQVISDLSNNIQYSGNIELQRMMKKSFVDVMLMEAKQEGGNLSRLTSKGVYLLCWLKRYQASLFSGWKLPQISCFFHMGGCRDDNECMFLKFLARLPVDVLILNPNLNIKCCLSDQWLYEVNYTDSLPIGKYPQETEDVQIGTAAYHAERELDSMMYQDSGMYRDRQYAKANTVVLKTMYEEIRLLWKEELKYRPNFSTVDDVVNMPVIFAKVSGVKEGQTAPYWASIKELVTEDTFLIQSAPFLEPTAPNPMRAYAAEFYKNGRLQRRRIKEHPKYPYGYLREEVQEHMLDKLQLLIDRKTVKGTFENGTEYTIIATVLHLPVDIVRMIQKFDFTKRNPKLIYIHTKETMISLEDTILTSYLSLVGFDIVFFVPTGYQSIERYFNTKGMEEHQIGEYLYDLQTPASMRPPAGMRPRWRDKFFKRGT